LRLIRSFAQRLRHRYQLVIRDQEDLAESYTVSFTYRQVVAFLSAFLSVLFVCSLLLSRTMLAQWLNPAYVEEENKKELQQLVASVEALEEQTFQQKEFIALLQAIIAGKEVLAHELPAADPSSYASGSNQATTYESAPGVADTLLQHDAVQGGPLTLWPQAERKFSACLFFPPTTGIITTPFRQEVGHYGVDIVAKEHAPIQSVADGVVVFAAWTIETGWVIVVQHHGDFVSVYKHNAALSKKVGNIVKAGDIIAIMGNSGELSTGPHLHFELWYRGNAVSPEDFIIF